MADRDLLFASLVGGGLALIAFGVGQGVRSYDREEMRDEDNRRALHTSKRYFRRLEHEAAEREARYRRGR